MEYLSPLLRTWRDLIYPPRQIIMLRVFAWYRAAARLVIMLPRSSASLIYGCAGLAILWGFYSALFYALAVVTSVWLVRPSTLPKSSHLLLDQSARFGAAIPLAILYGIGGSVVSLWILTMSAFFVFELPFNRTILCVFRFFLTMLVSLLPVGFLCALLDYGIATLFDTATPYAALAGVVAPLVMACIVVPLIVESFHAHRAWYDPL